MRDLGLKTTRNAAYQTADHAVWIRKYRKRVLSDAVADRLRGLLGDVAHAKAFEVRALEIQPDPVHLFFSAPPAIAPSLAIQMVQGHHGTEPERGVPAPAGRPPTRPPLGALVLRGDGRPVSAETIRRDIEGAEHVRTRR